MALQNIKNMGRPIALSSDVISSLHLPRAVSYALKALHFGNFLGRTITHLRFYYESPGKYLVGALLDKYAHGELVKRVAQIIAITDVFLKIVNEGSTIKAGITNVKTVYGIEQGEMSCYLNERISHETWAAHEGNAPGYLFLPKVLVPIAHRIGLFGRHFFATIGSLWRLNGLLFDLYDTAVLDSHEAGVVVQNLAINLSSIAEEGSGLGKKLASVVRTQKVAIDSMLKTLKVGYDAERLEQFLTNFSNSTVISSVVSESAHNVKQGVLGVALIAGQIAGFNMQSMPFSSIQPAESI